MEQQKRNTTLLVQETNNAKLTTSDDCFEVHATIPQADDHHPTRAHACCPSVLAQTDSRVPGDPVRVAPPRAHDHPPSADYACTRSPQADDHPVPAEHAAQADCAEINLQAISLEPPAPWVLTLVEVRSMDIKIIPAHAVPPELLMSPLA